MFVKSWVQSKSADLQSKLEEYIELAFYKALEWVMEQRDTNGNVRTVVETTLLGIVKVEITSLRKIARFSNDWLDCSFTRRNCKRQKSLCSGFDERLYL